MLEAPPHSIETPVDAASRIALLESENERLRLRDAERSAELKARERGIRLLEEALRVLKARSVRGQPREVERRSRPERPLYQRSGSHDGAHGGVGR